MNKKETIAAAKEKVNYFKKFKEKGLIPLNGDFFPCVHYPPITKYPPLREEQLLASYEKPPDDVFDIYVHIPFCLRHCFFCHYPVKINASEEEKDYYLNMLEKEMELWKDRLGVSFIKVRSILVGGGTPTNLPPEQLDRFFKFFTSKLNLSSCSQFSFDVDPTTLLGKEGWERLKIMRSYGVDRLTIGIQSLNDEILKKMNRAHNAQEAVQSIEVSRKAGFKLNIEFIYGYPGQTLENWYDVIEKATKLGTEEIQLYRLKIVPYGDYTAAITKLSKLKKEEFPTPEEAIAMKEVANLVLAEKGYKENLRRVFTKKREDYSHYAHNQCCELYDQIGFGLTAFSSLRDRFALNTQYFEEYYQAINSGRFPINRGLVRNEDDQLRWSFVLPLKNRSVAKKIYQRKTGKSLNGIFRKGIEKLKKYNLIYEDENVIRLTKLGAFFADEICILFYHPRYKPFPASFYNNGELNPYHNYYIY